MENNDLFDFELNEAEGFWSITGYYGKGEKVVFPAAYEGKPVKKIEDGFSPYYKRIKRVTIPEGYTSIGRRAFLRCTGLREIKLPESLTFIGESAFFDCMGLTEIKFPESLASVEWNVFGGCTGLTNVKIPESLTSIGNYVFEGCTELTEISVDENNPVFRSVDGVMFDKAMTTLLCFPEGRKGVYSVPEGIISIKSGAFDNCNLTGISFPQSLLFIEIHWDNCKQLADITVNEHHPNYCSIDGVLFDKECRTLLKYPRNKDKTDYAVPDGIMSIANFAFYGCKRLVNIVFPESLEIIRDYAFWNCEGLKDITLPMSLQYVGEGAFKDCPNLETVTLSKKTRIVYEAFEGFKGRLIYRD